MEGEAEDNAEHAHHIKIFEPEMAVPEGALYDNNGSKANQQFNTDLYAGDQCMSYTEYVKKEKFKEASAQNQTHKPTSKLQANRKFKSPADVSQNT